MHIRALSHLLARLGLTEDGHQRRHPEGPPGPTSRTRPRPSLHTKCHVTTMKPISARVSVRPTESNQRGGSRAGPMAQPMAVSARVGIGSHYEASCAASPHPGLGAPRACCSRSATPSFKKWRRTSSWPSNNEGAGEDVTLPSLRVSRRPIQTTLAAIGDAFQTTLAHLEAISTNDICTLS